MPPEDLAREVAAELARIPQVLAVAMAGSRTSGNHNLRTSEVLFDRDGWLARVKASADRAYPDELARAIIAKNWPLLRGAASAYPKQIALAAHREDLVAVNHRLAALLASAFDVLFALNRVTHPGEKRLLALASRLPLAPEDLRTRVELMLSFTSGSLESVPRSVEAFVDGLERLLSQEHALPDAFGV